jgi:lysophospholipase L1-like esterase
VRNPPGRREFLTASAGALTLAALSRRAGAEPGMRLPQLSPATPLTILFQGDSITDAGRARDSTVPNTAGGLGNGYPYLIAADELASHPNRDLRFFNRGVSGDKVPDLEHRWDADTLALKPDVLSVLVGVNDFWHKLLRGYAGTVEDYEAQYLSLLQSTRKALPGIRLVVLEPFVLRTGSVNAKWFPEFDQRRAAARRVAKAAGATFIPIQDLFNKLADKTPPAYWAADGVHPTAAGHAAIAHAWQNAVKL